MIFIKKAKWVLPILLLLAMPLASALTNSSSSITATVVVGCPFSIHIGSISPAIPKYGNFAFNYSIIPTLNCTVAAMNGKLDLSINNSTVYKMDLTSMQSNAISIYKNKISINASALSIGNYTLDIEFKNNQTSNASYSHFQVLAPANLSLENFTIPSPLSVGSDLYFYLRVLNIGNYSASNLTLHIEIGKNGPQINQSLSNIAAYPASENITLEESNLTSNPGTYTAFAYVTYKKSQSSNQISETNTLNTTYIVKPHSKSVPKVVVPPVPIPKVPKVVITNAPLYLTSTPDTTTGTSIGISNPSSQNESFNFSVPSYLSNVIKLSTNHLILSPGANISLSLLVNNRNLTTGVYNIPINVSATADNITHSYTDYVTYSVSSREPNKPVINTAVELQNNTNDGYVIISISTPSNVTITNGTAITYLPEGLVPNQTYMDAYGIPNNITEHNGYYYIEWHIAKLTPNQNIYAYVYVKSPSSQLLLSGIKTNIFVPTSSTASILHLLYVDSPIFKTYGNGTTEVELLYTGAYPENITFALTGPSYMRIYNASQTVSAVPNQLLYIYFPQKAGGISGTSTESLHITAPNADINYTVPLIVIQSVTTTTTTSTIAQSAIQLAFDEAKITAQRYLLFIVIAIIAVIFAIAYYLYNNKSHYVPSRAESIKRMKERIKRDLNEGK